MSLPLFLAISNTHKVDKSGSFNEHLLQEISCVRCQVALKQPSCIVSGDREGPHISSRSCVHKENLGGGQRMRLQWFCVYVHPNTNNDKALNQKLTKRRPRRCLIRGVNTRKKYLCTNLRIKEGGGRLLEWGVFSKN